MKRVLFVSYYFPPSGGPGVQRTLKFVKYLPEFGWQPTVLTVDPSSAAYPNLDPSLEAEVPKDVSVIRTRSWDPYGGYARMLGKRKQDTISVSFGGESTPGRLERIGRWIRANIFIPDARVGWVPFALHMARKLVREQAFDAMVTTGPPHSTHLIGLRTCRSSVSSIPWLADFRDPWTRIDYHQELPSSRCALAADRKMERHVLARADRVTTITPTILRFFRQDVDRTYDLVMNGFDPADFSEGVTVEPTGFVIRHIGNMPAARNPESLWKALSSIDAGSSFGASVELVGSVDPVIRESAETHGLGVATSIRGYVSHPEAVRLMQSSDVLLLVINRVPGAEGIMTGKLFEYVGSGRPVLGIGPASGDAADVIRSAGAGEMFDYDDAVGVGKFLRSHLEAKRSGRPFTGASSEAVRQYSRRGQAGSMARILDEMTAVTSQSGGKRTGDA